MNYLAHFLHYLAFLINFFGFLVLGPLASFICDVL